MQAEKKEFKRKTRTEQEAAKQAAIDGAVAAAEEESKEAAIDVFDLAAPKEILGAFGPSWAAEISALKKWNEKKEKLDVVIEAADTPKLAPGDYSGLFEVLKKLACDAHVTVSQYAIRAIGLLAKGLREGFHDHGVAAVPVLLPRFKEKRLTEEILTCLGHIMVCIEFGEVIESLSLVKTEKMPLTKINIMKFAE